MPFFYEFDIALRWADGNGDRGIYKQIIRGQHPKGWYGDLEISESYYYGPRETAKHQAWKIQSRVAFQDVLEIKASTASITSFLGADWRWDVRCFDHSKTWFYPGSPPKYLITTEPYNGADSTLAECARRGWPCEAMPWGAGLWYPVSEDGRLATRLVLVSPGKRGVNLDGMVQKLLATEQFWISQERWKEYHRSISVGAIQ